ncbi:unnamed protein product [Rhizophagus irregularis]|nr:unnamed protein product [Rhizophagus irregularis]CAB4418002.1 unnamed protein product [Rhizophagus irregularis]
MSRQTILRHPGLTYPKRYSVRMRLFFVVLTKPLCESSAIHITKENNAMANQWTLWKVIEGGEKWKALENIEENNNTEIYIKNKFKGIGKSYFGF